MLNGAYVIGRLRTAAATVTSDAGERSGDAIDAAAWARELGADAAAASHMADGCPACDDGSAYYPFKWRHGEARYLCERGHRWTCGWGHQESGYAYMNMSRRQTQAISSWRVPSPDTHTP